MFRLNAVPSFRVRIPSGEVKICTVRYPTDAEWSERMRHLKLLRTPLGREKFLSEIPDRVSADAALFAKICLDKDSGFDECEASAVISQIDGCRVIETDRAGENFRVVLEDAGETMIHILRGPTQRAKMDYERAETRMISGRRTDEFTAYLEPAADLFGKLTVSVEGYAGAVPIVHKYAVIREVLNQISNATSGIELDVPEAPGPGVSAN